MSWLRINIVLAIVAVFAAAAAAEAMIPHRLLASPLSQDGLERMIPKSFGKWSYDPTIRLVEPPGSDTLSKQIYNAEIARGYRDPSGRLIMLVIAYGASQSERLQLHRPEICYAAQGFRVTSPVTEFLALPSEPQPLPVRRLVGQREDRSEPITYWMRIGDTVATNAVARQILKVEYGLRGVIADGALIRISTLGLPLDQAYELETDFIADFLQIVDADTRRFVVGDPSQAITIGF
jgi:EpsI family protein